MGPAQTPLMSGMNRDTADGLTARESWHPVATNARISIVARTIRDRFISTPALVARWCKNHAPLIAPDSTNQSPEVWKTHELHLDRPAFFARRSWKGRPADDRPVADRLAVPDSGCELPQLRAAQEHHVRHAPRCVHETHALDGAVRSHDQFHPIHH